MIACAWIGVANAETPQEQADKLFAAGRELLTKQKDAKAACEKFEAAIKLDATATGTMLNLGLCYENLGKFATSIRWFRKAQSAAYENKLSDYEQAAKDHTSVITSKVPTVVLDISSAGPDVEIRVDGLKVDPMEYARFEVDPGPHEIIGRTAGKRRVREAIELQDGESRTVTLAFTERAVPVYVDRGASRRHGALVLGAAGVAAWGFTLFYGLHEKKIYEDPLHPDDKAKDRLRYVGTSVFVIGTGAVAAAIFLYLTAPGSEQVSDGTAFAPVIGNDNLGFAVTGSF